MFFLNLTMRIDLLLVYRHRLLMRIDPPTRVLSSAIKRSYTQHATQFSPSAQNTSPPPAKRHRGAASSGSPSPLPSARSTSKHFKLATRQPGSSSSSSRQNAKRGSLKRPAKKEVVVQSKTVLPGPHHNEAYIVKQHNKSVFAMKSYHKETPKSSVNNFCQVLNGKLPMFRTVDGVIIEGNNRIYAHR